MWQRGRARARRRPTPQAVVVAAAAAAVTAAPRVAARAAVTPTAAAVTATISNDEEESEKMKQLRLQQSAKAAMLLSRRRSGNPGTSAATIASKTTSVGDRRVGNASKARMNTSSSIGQLVDAVKTGSSSISDGSCARSNNGGYSSNDNKMTYYVCDVTNEDEVDSVIRSICENDAIDILVNNAGGSQSPKGPVGSLTGKDLEQLLKLNVISPHLITSAICKYSWATKEKKSKRKGEFKVN